MLLTSRPGLPLNCDSGELLTAIVHSHLHMIWLFRVGILCARAGLHMHTPTNGAAGSSQSMDRMQQGLKTSLLSELPGRQIENHGSDGMLHIAQCKHRQLFRCVCHALFSMLCAKHLVTD